MRNWIQDAGFVHVTYADNKEPKGSLHLFRLIATSYYEFSSYYYFPARFRLTSTSKDWPSFESKSTEDQSSKAKDLKEKTSLSGGLLGVR